MAPTRNRRARLPDPPAPLTEPRIYVKQFKIGGPWHVVLVEPWGKAWGRESSMGSNADPAVAGQRALDVASQRGVDVANIHINHPLHQGLSNN